MPPWVPEWIVGLVGRTLCRFRKHNVTCRGRHDHTGRETLGWPRM